MKQQKLGAELDHKDLETEQLEQDGLTYESVALDDITKENVFTTDEKGKTIIDKKNGVLDSWEEWWFVCYLKELKEAGVLLDADKNAEPLGLSSPIRHNFTKMMKTKTKAMVRHLANPFTYEHDFNIKWNVEWIDKFYTVINVGKQYGKIKAPFITFSGKFDASLVEIKGDYTPAQELWKTNLKIAWLYEMRQMYVQMVRVPKMFKDTFTPEAYVEHMKYVIKSKRGQSKLKYKPITCAEYLNKLKKDTDGQQTLQ